MKPNLKLLSKALFCGCLFTSGLLPQANARTLQSDGGNPTKLIEFEVYRVNDRAELHWKSKGLTFDKYVIERSLDRESWVEILHIKGHEHGLNNMEHIDVDNTAPSSKLFYRIKRLDVNGIPTYSSIVLIPPANEFSTNNETIEIQTLSDSLNIGSELNLNFIQPSHQGLG